MYRGSLKLLLKFRPIVITLILIVFSVEMVNQTYLYDHLNISYIFIPLSSYMSLKITESILGSELDKYSVDQVLYSRFFWRYFGLTFPLLIALVLVYRLAPSFAGDFSDSISRGVLVVVLSLISHFILCFLFLVQFSFFGLKLPEVVAGRISSEKTRLALKPKQFWLIFSRLLVGPVLVSSIGVVVNYSAYSINPALRFLLLESWIPNIFGITLFLFCLFMQVWAVVMTFWVLAHAYIRIEFGDKGMQVIYRY